MSDFPTTPRLLNKEDFYMRTMQNYKERPVDYLEAVLLTCQQFGIEVEDVKKHLDERLLDVLSEDAASLNLLTGK